MYFLASKLLWLVASPSNALILCGLAGLLLAAVTRWRRTGLMLVALSACQLLVPFAGPESDSSPSESVEATAPGDSDSAEPTAQPAVPTPLPTAQPDPVAPTPEIPPPYY